MTRSRFVLLICLCLALAACAPAQPRSTVIAWHSLSGARERALLSLIDTWNQTNPDGILVVPERRDPAVQHKAMLDGAVRGALPDLALISPAQAAVYDQRGLLTPLDPFTTDSEPAMGWDAAERSDLYSFIQNAGRTPQGRLVGIPMGGEARMLLSNRDWSTTLQQPDLPADWAAFGKLCEAATDRLAGTVCYGVNPSDALFEEWMEAHGAPVLAPEGGLQIATAQTAAAIEELVSDLQTGQAYRVTLPERSTDDFAAARVMFATDWTSRLDDYVDIIRERSNFNIDAGTLPTPAGSPPAALYRAPLWVLPKSDSERSRDTSRDAWKFVNWLQDEEQTARWAAETGDLPARASAVARLDLNPSAPADSARAAILQRVAPNARPAPVISGWPCVQDELASGLRRIFEGQPITDTLLTVQARAQEVLNTDCSAP